MKKLTVYTAIVLVFLLLLSSCSSPAEVTDTEAETAHEVTQTETVTETDTETEPETETETENGTVTETETETETETGAETETETETEAETETETEAAAETESQTEKVTQTETETETEAETTTKTPDPPVYEAPYYDTCVRYAYSTLDNGKKQLYNNVLKAALCRAEYVDIPDAETARYIYECVIFDTPELFYLSETPLIEGGKLKFDYVFTAEKAEAFASQLDNAYKAFTAAEIRDGMTDYQKLQTLYEYIINKTKYADEADTDYEAGVFNEAVYRSVSAIGPLLDSKAICTGYARATQYLALRLGIQTYTVKGAASDDGGIHYYNLVLLGNDYYYVDTTWGDPVDPNRSKDYLTYNYFCITTEELLRSHLINTCVPMPICTATEYNYFIYNGLTANTADEAAQIIYEAYMRGESEVRVKTDYDKLDEICSYLPDAINRVFSEKGIYVLYRYGRSSNTSTVFVRFD